MADISVTIDTDGTSGDYSSLALAEAGEQTTYSDLVTDGNTMTFNCQATDGDADETTVIFAGWTTSTDNDITISGDNDAGKWNSNAYRLDTDVGGSTTSSMKISASNITIDSLQIRNTSSWSSASTVRIDDLNNIHINSTIVVGYTSGSTAMGISCPSLSNTDAVSIYNSIIYNAGSAGIYVGQGAQPSVLIYNCTIVDCNGYAVDGWSNRAEIKNSISYNNTDGWKSDVGNSDSNYCLSDDTTSLSNDSNAWTSASIDFSDYSGDDFSLDASEDGNYEGENLFTIFTTDIKGKTRSDWDIGAVEIVASGGSTLLPNMFNHYNKNIGT